MIAGLLCVQAGAQTTGAKLSGPLDDGGPAAYSSSRLYLDRNSAPGAAPGAGTDDLLPRTASAASGAWGGGALATADRPALRPFRSLAVGFKVGTGGLGVEAATALAPVLNLRGSFQIFDYKLLIKTNGIQANSDFTLQNGQVSLDIFPFHNAFRISPGVTVHNDNHITAALLVPGGSSFSLGDGDYTSDPANPINGIARLTFGNSVAPRLTLGFGNMVSRRGHFSFPTEIGFEYTSQPALNVILFGSACDSQNNCGDINSGDGPANLKTEVSRLQSDISPLRFFPIVSTGVSYRFGSR